jgi:hypothetical protein
LLDKLIELDQAKHITLSIQTNLSIDKDFIFLNYIDKFKEIHLGVSIDAVGKYNDYMSTDEVLKIKAKLEKILDIEKEYKEANTDEEKELIYKRLSKYKTYSIKDFIDYDIENI